MSFKKTSKDIEIKRTMSQEPIENEKEIAKVDYDELLSAAGEFGRYQVFLFFATGPFYMFGVIVYFVQMFMTEVSPNHWCWIPELANLTDIERRSIAIPNDAASKFGYSQCRAYDANWTEVFMKGLEPNESWSTLPCQNGWEFNTTEFPYATIASELEWVCDKNSYQATAQSVFFVGSIVGGFVVGWIADKFGRVAAAVSSNMFGCIGGIASIFALNLTGFAICRFIVGMAYDNCMMMMYLLLLEYVAPKYRTIMANLSFSIFYCCFIVVLPWIALLCGHWKILALATSIPLALSILAPLLIPESPRWLLSQNRVDKAIQKVLNIAKCNKKVVSPELIEQFKTTVANHPEEKGNWSDLLKKPLLRRIFILICVEYMCCACLFDGLVRSVGHLDFNFFLSFSVASLTEFPSIMLLAFVMDWMGRRWLMVTVMSAACCFGILSVFVGSGVTPIIFATIARFGSNMAVNTAMQWGAELLPTPVRGSGASIIHVCGYVSTVVSPYIVYLNTFYSWLPMTIFGAIAGLGALIGFLLPETANKPMPSTFADAEELVRQQNLFEMPCLRRNDVSNERGQGNINNQK